MTIDLIELKVHFEKYLKLCKKEDIYIARNGKVVAKLSDPYQLHVKVSEPAFDETTPDPSWKKILESKLIR